MDCTGNRISRAATNAASVREYSHAQREQLHRSTTSFAPNNTVNNAQHSAFRSSNVELDQDPGHGSSKGGSEEGHNGAGSALEGAHRKKVARRNARKLRSCTDFAAAGANRKRRPIMQVPLEVANAAESHQVACNGEQLKSILHRIHLGPERENKNRAYIDKMLSRMTPQEAQSFDSGAQYTSNNRFAGIYT